MTCQRCGGLMHGERATQGKQAIHLMACILCGERVDDTIQFNRSFYRQESMRQKNERIMREYLHELLRAERAINTAQSGTV